MSQQINPEQLAQMIASIERRIACKKQQQRSYAQFLELAPLIADALFAAGRYEGSPAPTLERAQEEQHTATDFREGLIDFFAANFDWEALDIGDMEIQLAALKQAQAQMSSVIQIPQVRPNNKKPAW